MGGWIIVIFIFWGISSLVKKYESKNKEIKKLNTLLDSYRNKTREEFLQKELEYARKESEIEKRQNTTTQLFATKEEELNLQRRNFEEHIATTRSNLTAIPYLAHIVADYDTRGLDILAQQLNWGSDQKRLKKVQSILEIKREAKELISQYKEAEYQLAYALEMFPALEDFLNTEYSQLPTADFSKLSSEHHDSVRNYLSKEEYCKLSTIERNQLALDRYRESHRKSNWQIGRDYELYVGYKYSLKGYQIDYYGSYNGLEDLGRDLIATKDNLTLIIQCKYWSAKKQIHEKHINQLYGTMACYCFENNLPKDQVRGILVTNITISPTARRFANFLGIEVVENYALGAYPCIKCNINQNEWGEVTKIYHLPFDQQYDTCKIDSPGEFYAMTVAEAEKAGFRRAYRWHSE